MLQDASQEPLLTHSSTPSTLPPVKRPGAGKQQIAAMRFGLRKDARAIDSQDLAELCRRATAKELLDADPMRNACVAQCIALGRFSNHEVADVLGRRLRQKRPRKQFLAVRLVADVRPPVFLLMLSTVPCGRLDVEALLHR